MFATRVSRVLIFTAASLFLLAGCKGHGSSSQIPQTLTNWNWESGSNAANSYGYYDPTTKGAPTSVGQPSGRSGAMSWKDSNGQFWVFSGTGGTNDMWKFNSNSLQWTWISGTSSSAQPAAGSYGTIGVESTSNFPGQRSSAVTWIDTSGLLWMYGGYGIDSNGLVGYLNDLWSFNPTTSSWTWKGGGNVGGSSSTTCSWGSIGVAATSNQPSPRSNGAAWTDTSTGNFYMVGGQGYLSTLCGGSNSTGLQNDFWQYNPVSNQWTWLGGTQSFYTKGIYGQQNHPALTNQPGARQSATTWTDVTGAFWMFGGSGIDWEDGNGLLNDLWKFDPATGMWTWVSGANTINTIGNYGTVGVAASTNQPGSRWGGMGWSDSGGNLWLFGGYGINASGTIVVLNDLWEYQGALKQWVWINGSYNGNVAGYYGTITVLSGSNMPGSRYGASGWKDSSGDFWMFGGDGNDAVGANGHLGDVWKFIP